MTANDAARGEQIGRSGKYAAAVAPQLDWPEEPPDDDAHHVGEWQPSGNGQHPPNSGADEQAEKDWRERGVEVELDRLRIRKEAQRRLDDENRPPLILPPVKGLETLLAEPDSPTRYRIDAVAPADSRIMLSAQYKAGKTTLRDNLVRTLADAEPFLGRFTVNTPSQRLVLIDDELSKDMLRRWLRDQRIVNTAAVADVIALRGRVGTLNLLDDRTRSQWAARLRDLGCDYLILDCLRPVLDALGLDEQHGAGTFAVAFDALLADAGISDSLIVHHMGHTGERSRGDSRLQDWPDATWRLVRETDDPGSPRYFTAYGRDVDVHEGRLAFDPATRRLTYAAGSRGDAKTEAAFAAVIDLLAHDEGLSKNAIERDISGDHTQRAIRDAINRAVRNGLVAVREGPRRAKLHSIASPCSECGMPVAIGEDRHQSCPSGPEGLFK